jgi:putative spermidine/putrescine transport system substrate-binding protein
MRRWTAIPAVVVAIAVVAGCSGGGGSPSAAAPSTAASVAPPSSAPSAGSAGASAATSAACNPPRQEGVKLTYVSFGGAYQEAQRKAWLQPYSDLTGVEIAEDEGSSNAKIKAMVEAGQVTWDVVDVGNDFGLDAHKDLLEPLDYTLIPRDEVIDGFAGDYRVADMTYGVALAYNTEKTAGQVPAGWADFFDTTKFPGKRGMWDYSEGGIFEVALMADGVKPADLYPLDLARATKKLDTIKNDLVFWASGAESQELIGSGEVAMTLIWNGRGWSAKHTDKKPVEIQWNQQIVTADYLVVPKGTPNKDAAMKFIAYAICAANNAKPSEFIPYGPINKNSKPAPANEPDLSVSNADENSAYFDDEYLIANFAKIDAAYQAWKTQ